MQRITGFGRGQSISNEQSSIVPHIECRRLKKCTIRIDTLISFFFSMLMLLLYWCIAMETTEKKLPLKLTINSCSFTGNVISFWGCRTKLNTKNGKCRSKEPKRNDSSELWKETHMNYVCADVDYPTNSGFMMGVSQRNQRIKNHTTMTMVDTKKNDAIDEHKSQRMICTSLWIVERAKETQWASDIPSWVEISVHYSAGSICSWRNDTYKISCVCTANTKHWATFNACAIFPIDNATATDLAEPNRVYMCVCTAFWCKLFTTAMSKIW